MRAFGRTNLDRARRDLAVAADNHHAVALRGARDGLLWQGNGVAGLRLLQPHAHVQPRQQLAVGIGHFGAQRDLARRRIDRQVRKQQPSGLGVLRAVFQHDAHAGRLLAAGALELAAFHRLAQLHHVRSRLGEVDVHRVDLLDHGQLRRFALPDQRAFGHQRAANAARNRGRHRGVAQRDARRLHIGFGHGDIGGGLLLRGHGVGVFLLADGVGFDQRLVAFGQGGGLG